MNQSRILRIKPVLVSLQDSAIGSPSPGSAERRRSSARTSQPPPLPLQLQLRLRELRRPGARRSRWRQALLCLAGDEDFRRQRERAAREQAGERRHVNSVSRIDRVARVLFPASFCLLNLAYWVAYGGREQDFRWGDAGAGGPGTAIYLDH